MGDMGDYYRDTREHFKQQRADAKAERLAEADRLLGDQFDKLSPHHWRTTIAGYILDYWPTTGAYRWTNKTKYAEPAYMVELLSRLRWQEENGARERPKT